MNTVPLAKMTRAELFAASLNYDHFRGRLEAARATLRDEAATDREHAEALAEESRCLLELTALEPLQQSYLDEREETRRDGMTE